MSTDRGRRVLLPVLSFALPVTVYLAVMALAGVYPFGGNSLMLWDIDTQYIPFLTYLREAVTGGRDLLYTFERVLGNGTADLLAYYLASPLNALIFLFGDMVDAVTVLMVLKIGLCGLTSYVYLQKTRSLGAGALLFSTSYALMGFVAVYFYHIMWMDCLILLPLIVLGYLRIAEGKAPFLFIAMLALAMICQFYIAYMICLFMVLYLVYDLLTNKRKARRIILTFAGSACLATMIGAALLLPAYVALAQGPGIRGFGELSLAQVASLQGVFTKVYTASSSVVQQRSGLPNIYVGIPLFLLSVLYFFNRAVPLRRRMLSLGFLLVFIVSFLFATPYFAWHAFEPPTYYPARFSFLFSFLLIDYAAQGAEELKRFPPARLKRTIGVACAVFAALTALLFYKLTVEYLAYKTIVLDVVFFSAAGLCVWFGLRKERRRRLCIAGFCAMQIVCLFLNSYYAYRRIGAEYTPTIDTYRAETQTDLALVRRVRESDGGLYRMEFDVHRIDNIPIAYGFNGLSFDGSVYSASAYAFAKALGMRESDYHIKYRSGLTPVVESLMGLKYVVRKDGNALEALPDGYTLLWRDGGYACYENTYAMPLAYLAPPQTCALTDANPFVNQNLMLSDLLGEDVLVFDPVWDIKREYDGTWETDTFGVKADRLLYMKVAGTKVHFNGGEEESGARYQTMVLLPVAEADTTYQIRMTAPLGIHLAYYDPEAFEKAHAALALYAADVQSDTDSHLVIAANVTDDHTQLLITLPYDKGWRVWVDGERAEPVSRYGALLAVNLPQGSHTVELHYTPSGLWAGIAVSLSGLALVVLWIALRRKRKRSPDTKKGGMPPLPAA